MHRTNWKRQGRKKGKKDDKAGQKVDLYAMLGLANERWTATEAQIKLGALAAEHTLAGGMHSASSMVTSGYWPTAMRALCRALQCILQLLGVPARLLPWDTIGACSCRRNRGTRVVHSGECSAREPWARLHTCRAAYRKAALEHHPDKAGAGVADEGEKHAIEERFKAIQDAYETLSDPVKRREFDSVDDFDDTLPLDCAPADFFKVAAHLLGGALLHACLAACCPIPVGCTPVHTGRPWIGPRSCPVPACSTAYCLQKVVVVGLCTNGLEEVADFQSGQQRCRTGANAHLIAVCAQVFGPAFRRNARWSVGAPVPEVGEEGTPWEAVDAFYDFWFGFRSWRECPHPDEEDTEQAECREEKRCAHLQGVSPFYPLLALHACPILHLDVACEVCPRAGPAFLMLVI